jgi:hypothetical protein
LYFDDGTVDLACPPLKSLLRIMVDGTDEGRGLDHPEIRRMFTVEHLLESEWYSERLRARQAVEARLARRNVEYLEHFLAKASYTEEARRLGIPERLQHARRHFKRVQSEDYLAGLRGTIGAQPLPAAAR